MDSFEVELQTLTSNELYEKGMAYFYGKDDVRKDYEKALRCFIKAVDFGNARAMEQIGYMYNLGCGVSEDKSEALKWYRRAAELGDLYSMKEFASELESGEIIDKNISEAINWLEKSAELGDKEAMYSLAKFLIKYQRKESSALEWLKRRNDGNELKISADLASIYYDCEPEKSIEIYKELSASGENYGYTLGEMYKKGIGTEKNLTEAIKWFEKAARIENPADHSEEYCKWDGMLKLAEIYISLKDEETALEWLTERNEGIKIFAMSEMGHIYYGDNEFEYEDTSLVNKYKAFEWFKKLYKLKDSYGAYYYGEMWERRSRSKALRIYKYGTKFGSERCFRRIIQLYLEDGNIIEAARWLVKYVNIADGGIFDKAYLTPFKELKQITTFFTGAPMEEVIKLYGGDRKFAAEEIYSFARACDKTPLNLYSKLAIMSVAVDLMGDSCPIGIIERLASRYDEIYREVKDNGVSDEIEGDEEELMLKKLFKTYKGSSEEKNYHGAEYYREKFLYLNSKLRLRL